jgi:hypothetical protein
MRTAVNFVWLLFILGPVLRAQSASGGLTGTVVDPAGLPVAKAGVRITAENTGLSLSGTTNSSGSFAFAGLPPGDYSVEVNAPGFRPRLIRHFKVDVAKENVLPPVRLELGSVSETVEVKAQAGQVQTANAELTSTITRQQIEHLPLVERDPLSLIGLQAGVAYNGASAANGTTINGQRSSFSNVTLDGINIQDNYIRDNALDFVPSRLLVDAISEFTVTVQNAGPAHGFGSSQVNFITPSGGNEFHGSGYWFNRNNKFAANQWFSNQAGTPKPFLNLNQLGGAIGGPVIRNKLLFFANYEAYRQRHEELADQVILTANARQGIFTYVDSRGRVQRVNVLAAARLNPDPRAAQLLQSVPGPQKINNFNVGDSSPGLLRNTAGYQFNTRDQVDRDYVTSRLDYIISTRHLISGTYRYNTELLDRADAGVGFHTVPPVENHVHDHFLSLAWRWTPAPVFTNELRGGMNLAPAAFDTREARGNQLFDGFIFTNPVVNFDPQGRNTNTYNYMDNVNWQRGRHDLRFGVQTQRIAVEPFDRAGLIPDYGIGFSVNNPRALTANFFPGNISGNDLAIANSLLASLAGVVGSASQTFNIASRTSGFVPGQEFRRHYSLNSYSFYGQDAWKIRRRLALNLGVRWEYAGRFDERDGLLLAPVFTSIGVPATLLSNATIDFAGSAVNRPLYNKDLNNFAPNAGIALDPFGDGKTAVRAGYSINYVNDQMILAAENATINNHGLQDRLTLTSLAATMSGALPTFATPAFQVPLQASTNFANDPTAAIFAVDPQLRTPYVQQWTFSIQRQIKPNTAAEVRYAGNHGTKLLRGFDYNQIIIRQNGFLDDFLRARSNGFLSQRINGSFDPAYNAGIPGSQQLRIFPQLDHGGFLGDATVQSLIRSGEPGQLAFLYYVNGLNGPVPFVRNPNTLVADLITNYSNSSYHALQAEIRRRNAGGVEFQANYTFSKVLTDSSGTQVRFDPFLDFGNGKIERSRAEFDVTHVFNANFVAPLPFGTNHRLHYKPLDRLWSGWTLGSIIAWQSGAPFSILSGRGTLNRTRRSSENTAVTLLNKQQLDQIAGFRMTGNGPYIISPSAINPADNTGVAGDGEAPFNGQVFFHPAPGQIGTLQRRMFSGPSVFALDLKIDKEIAIRERQRLRVEATFTNLLNHPVFLAGDQYLDSTQFGHINAVLVGARVLQFGLRYSF